MQSALAPRAYRYEVLDGWGKLPDGWVLRDVAAIAVDEKDRVYVFHRGEHPMIVFERDGSFIGSWGDGIFSRPHGLHFGHDGMLYCTDDGDHTVRKCTPDGKVLLEIGLRNRPALYMSGKPFNRCTHTALAPNGEIYVSDGYGNARVHKYSPDGTLLMSWGESGADIGQFNVPHNICCDANGWVYVADRENHRVQIFDKNGRYETHWNNLHRPCALCLNGRSEPILYVSEMGPTMAVNRRAPNLGPRISVLSSAGELLSRFGGAHAGTGPDEFIAPHGIAVDTRGDIYVGELSHSAWPQIFPDTPVPPGLRALRKLRASAECE